MKDDIKQSSNPSQLITMLGHAVKESVPPPQFDQPPHMDSPPLDLLPQTAHLLKPPRRRFVRWLAIAIMALIVTAAVWALLWYRSAINPRDARDKTTIRVEIPLGTNPTAVANLLQQKNVIRSALAFDIYTHLHHSRVALQAGSYSLSPSTSVSDLVTHLTSGKSDQFDITFLPGATLSQNRQVFLKAGYNAAEIDAAFKKTYHRPLFTDKPANSDLEGYIYGETYRFSTSASVEEILNKTFGEYEKELTAYNFTAGFKAHGLNLYQGITLASIIQREVSSPNDRKQVAQVFYSRLAAGMALGSDVTYQYAADKLGVARDVNLDSPYNTRRYAGLPPGPISVPSLSALQAVADPAPGDYLFFLSGDDNITYFAQTDVQHNNNIRLHCQKKCSIQ